MNQYYQDSTHKNSDWEHTLLDIIQIYASLERPDERKIGEFYEILQNTVDEMGKKLHM